MKEASEFPDLNTFGDIKEHLEKLLASDLSEKMKDAYCTNIFLNLAKARSAGFTTAWEHQDIRYENKIKHLKGE